MRFLIILFLSFAPTMAAAASDRVALVIGMADYATVPDLENTLNDARGIADTLADVGFDVTRVMDGSGAELRDTLDTFAFRAETADLALIYYAGHGVEVEGRNFLIPVDARVENNADIQRQGVSLDQLLAVVDGARTMRIVILDSCRDNPFGGRLDPALQQASQAETSAPRSTAAGTRSTGQTGLAPPSPDSGTLVAYAAEDGKTALDGQGKHSPFARALMETLPTKGLEISLMFRQVRDRVLELTNNQQEPHTYGSLSGTPFYLAGSEEGDLPIGNPRQAWSEIQPAQELRLAALAEKGDTRSMLGLAYMRMNAADHRYAPSEAVKLLQRAADKGSAEAQYELALAYEKGLGVAQDIDKAVELMHKAAAQDMPDALNDLGFFYFQGDMGVPRDVPRALKLFERAAIQRHPEAMFNFAAMIDDGEIAGKGPEDAGDLLYRALRSGSRDVFRILQERPTMFKLETRKALQRRLSDRAFYEGPIDGQFGPGTQRGIRAAFGALEG